MKENSRLLLFTGSYASTTDNGVQVYEFDGGAGGKLKLLDSVQGIANPTFVNVDTAKNRLYAISEKLNGEGVKEGEVVTLSIDAQTGKLTELSRISTMPATDAGQTTTCHINRDSDSAYLVVCSYHGGLVGLLSVDADGNPVRLTDTAVHTGKGTVPGQEKPHPHSAVFSPDERFLFVSDLGLDLIRTYHINRDAGTLEVQGEIKVAEGAGPRHFVFHPDGKSAYVINELNSTVTSFLYDSESAVLKTSVTVPTLPDDYSYTNNGCAEIAFSKDGRFLYGSNRGHDSIVVYAVNAETAELTLVQHESTRGGHPRHFTVTPDGGYLIVANRDGNNLVVFSLDTATGRLSFTGNEAETSKPVCVKPAVFPV
ncbi:lactonase family protein [Paenibacillus camerounensis]|uniref:lactonase family protein n=1 Tax=Paenibacillus camerounensis TaxID=1243663 RepID=UPI0005A62C2C|nr:lactonase family protein [Paenibacillus camerounensis]